MVGRSLLFKLMGAFALVVLVVVGLVSFIANQATAREFQVFMFGGGMATGDDIATALTNHYAARGSWNGVESLLSQPGMMGRGMMGMMGNRILVTDAAGTIVADSSGGSLGARLSENELRGWTPLRVAGRVVGYMLAQGMRMPMRPNAFLAADEQDFLDRVNRSILLAGLAAGLVALLLGFVLFRQITAPLEQLTRAARGIARGNLQQRVVVRTADEIGELGQAFNAMAQALAQAEELRRHMVADIAHELRTPLAVMQSNLEALLDGIYPATPEQIAAIHQETVHLTRLVNDLRELALAEAGQLTIEKEPTDIADLARRVVTTFETRAAEKSVSLELEAASNLPLVNADSGRIQQVLTNLIDNALRHTPADGLIRVEIREMRGIKEIRERFPSFSSFPSFPVLSVSVHDTGPGIPADDLPYIFERFYRGDKSRARATGGSGLGLAIAKQLVEAHGGCIWAESAVNQGTTVTFALPIK